MKKQIALATKNNSLETDFKDQLSGLEVIIYRKIESIKNDDSLILFIDEELFPSKDSGQFFLSKIRKKNTTIPLLLIFRVEALKNLKPEWSFDEFILYPFRVRELQARINRFLWKNKNLSEELEVGNITINLSEYTVFLGNKKLDLTYKEFEILRILVQNKKIVFSRKELLKKIWGIDYIGGTRTVDVHIRRLRGKLGGEFNSIIETIRNVGYRCK